MIACQDDKGGLVMVIVNLLYLELMKTQACRYTSEEFVLVKSSGVKRHIFGEDTP